MEIKLQTKVMGIMQTPSGRQDLTLSDGDKLIADTYIPTFGLIPNSSYIPTKFLNANGSVAVDEYLKVKGAEDVWAVGDVSDVEYSQFISCDRQSVYCAKSIISILSNKTPLPYKAISRRMITSPCLPPIWKYRLIFLLSGFMGLQIGKKAATGHFGSLKIPSFIVVRARKTLFVENMGPTVDGSLF